MSRWDWVYELVPRSAIEVVVEEISKRLASELAVWPLVVEWTDDATRSHYDPLYRPGARSPSRDAVLEGLKVARWELGRETNSLNQYLRNDGFAHATRNEIDFLAAELVWRYLVEILLDLAEKSEGRIKRHHLVACLDATDRRLASEN